MTMDGPFFPFIVIFMALIGSRELVVTLASDEIRDNGISPGFTRPSDVNTSDAPSKLECLQLDTAILPPANIRHVMEDIYTSLTVNRSTTSLSRRRCQSASDPRVSSMCVAGFSCGIITAVLTVVAIMDILNCLQPYWSSKRNSRTNKHRGFGNKGVTLRCRKHDEV
ncbi:hypothetical protein RRG08_034163 [Elysia crispata]|uniref:Uncharacterized protein n=1 Tax=Elysia crispata TaxID=231223 RepID=A0AAE1DIZ5_9GAST|nr:hypothetical protein RRG08_034163 [Elysia crispata]